MQHPTQSCWPSLRGRSIIVTGGGRGLGREMALALAEYGANVMITAARSADQLAQVQQAADELPGTISTLLADTTSYRDCQRVVDATLQQAGALHGLINNAGRGMRLISETFNREPARFWNTDPAAWREIVDINVNGTFNMARAVTPLLLDQDFGKIINISTSLQTMVREGYAPYGPSKAALEACTRIWSADLQGSGVTVNALLPGGATDTALLPDAVNKRGADGLLLAPVIMRQPTLWLCSDNSNGHTGQRYIARLWDDSLDADLAAEAAREDGAALPRLM